MRGCGRSVRPAICKDRTSYFKPFIHVRQKNFKNLLTLAQKLLAKKSRNDHFRKTADFVVVAFYRDTVYIFTVIADTDGHG